MSALVIGHANVFAANPTPGAAVRAIRAVDADSFGINEGNRVIAHLRASRGTRLTVAPATGRARETPIITRSSLPALGAMSVRICGEAEPLKWAPPRWATVAMFEHELGRIAHVNVHLHAVVTGVPVSTPRVREYAASTEAIASLIAYLEREMFMVVLTGDVNMTAAGARGVSWSALETADRAGLVTHMHGVELVAHSREFRRVDVDVIPKHETGSDHPFIVTTLRRSK